jgi:hypothetical protein
LIQQQHYHKRVELIAQCDRINDSTIEERPPITKDACKVVGSKKTKGGRRGGGRKTKCVDDGYDMPTTRYCTFKFNGQSFKPK